MAESTRLRAARHQQRGRNLLKAFVLACPVVPRLRQEPSTFAATTVTTMCMETPADIHTTQLCMCAGACLGLVIFGVALDFWGFYMMLCGQARVCSSVCKTINIAMHIQVTRPALAPRWVLRKN
jgi:hypothetical protein